MSLLADAAARPTTSPATLTLNLLTGPSRTWATAGAPVQAAQRQLGDTTVTYTRQPVRAVHGASHTGHWAALTITRPDATLRIRFPSISDAQGMQTTLVRLPLTRHLGAAVADIFPDDTYHRPATTTDEQALRTVEGLLRAAHTIPDPQLHPLTDPDDPTLDRADPQHAHALLALERIRALTAHLDPDVYRRWQRAHNAYHGNDRTLLPVDTVTACHRQQLDYDMAAQYTLIHYDKWSADYPASGPRSTFTEELVLAGRLASVWGPFVRRGWTPEAYQRLRNADLGNFILLDGTRATSFSCGHCPDTGWAHLPAEDAIAAAAAGLTPHELDQHLARGDWDRATAAVFATLRNTSPALTA